MLSKSSGIQVNSGRLVLIAVAAMSASHARTAGLRPARRRSVAIRPNARAAEASKGSGSKTGSASWRWSCLAARSSASSVIKGPTEGSAKVIALHCCRVRFHGALRRGRRARVVEDLGSVWSAFDGLVANRQIKGIYVPDSYVAAVAISHKARLATRDRGFSRFPGLSWFDPGQRAADVALPRCPACPPPAISDPLGRTSIVRSTAIRLSPKFGT